MTYKSSQSGIQLSSISCYCKRYSFLIICSLCALFWAALFLSEDVFDVGSRRLCNMSYVIWQVCLNLSDLICFYVVDRVSPVYQTNLVVEAINYNQLFYFFFVRDKW